MKSKEESFIKRILKGWLYLLGGTMMNMWFCTVMVGVFRGSVLITLLVGIAAIVIVNGLFFNYSYNAGKLDRELIKFHGKEKNFSMPVKMALLVPLPHYIMYTALILAKAGVIASSGSDYFLSYYILANLHVLPWVSLFTEARTTDSLTWGGAAGLLLILIIEPAVISITYVCTLNSIDIKALLYYGKNKDK